MTNNYYCNPNLKFYRIPGYNGYEFNFEYQFVRSIKNYKVNPTGKPLKKYTDSKGDYYKMSNAQNVVCKVYVSEIIRLIQEAPIKTIVNGNDTNLSPRNTVTRNKYRNVDQNDPKYATFFPDFSDMIVKS